MVDPAGYTTYNQKSGHIFKINTEIKDDAVTDEDYLICTPMLLGFSFKEKCWSKNEEIYDEIDADKLNSRA